MKYGAVRKLCQKHTLSSPYGVYHCHLFRYKIHLKRSQRAETSSCCSAVFVVATIRIALKCLSLKLAQSKQNRIASNRRRLLLMKRGRLELRFSTVKQHSKSLASIPLSK